MSTPDFKPALWDGISFVPPLAADKEEFRARCRHSTSQQLESLKATPAFRRWNENRDAQRARASWWPLTPNTMWPVLLTTLYVVLVLATMNHWRLRDQEYQAAFAASNEAETRLSNTISEYRQQLSTVEGLIQRKNNELASVSTSLQERQSALQLAQSSTTTHEQRLSQLNHEVQTTEGELRRLQEKLTQVTDRVARKELELRKAALELQKTQEGQPLSAYDDVSRQDAADADIYANRTHADVYLVALLLGVVELLCFALSRRNVMQLAAEPPALAVTAKEGEKAPEEVASHPVNLDTTPKDSAIPSPSQSRPSGNGEFVPRDNEEQARMLQFQDRVAKLERDIQERNNTIMYHNNLMNSIQESLMEATAELAHNRNLNEHLKKKLRALESKNPELLEAVQYSPRRPSSPGATPQQMSAMNGIVHRYARTPDSRLPLKPALYRSSPRSSAASAQSDSTRDEALCEDAPLSSLHSSASSIGKENGAPALGAFSWLTKGAKVPYAAPLSPALSPDAVHL